MLYPTLKQLGPDVYITYNMKETNGNIIHKSLCFPLLLEKLVTALKILFLCCGFHSAIITVIIVNITLIMIVYVKGLPWHNKQIGVQLG